MTDSIGSNDGYDVVVIGSGPAGLSAALAAAECGASVLLCERLRQFGTKLLASGGSKCNISNTLEADAFLEASASHKSSGEKYLTQPSLVLAGHYCGGVGRLPLVGCVFALASENNDENGYACGMLCDKGSVGTVLDGGGFVGFFDGVVANNNSEITCRNGVLQDCGRYAVQARHLSRVSVRGADLSGAGQCAVYANRVSQVDARAAWSAGARNGLLAANDSTINANDATLQGLWGEYIAAADALSTVNCGNLVGDDYYGGGPCFQVRNGSQMALHGLSGNLWEGQAPLYSQQPNQLTGEGILYVGEGEGYDDP